MKNVLFFLILIPLFTISQSLENSNWVFGQSNVIQFNENPLIFPSVYSVDTSPPYFSFEGCASVSSRNGDLLFFTNGISLWRNFYDDYQLITNNLKGHLSSGQNVIIVPRPNHPNNYYIITIDGYSGDNKGIFYSEIDLSIGNGQMVSLNVPLKDQNGILINELYDNQSEGLTSTKHQNGSDFLIVTHVLNQNNSNLLTYQVTESGINDTPISVTPTPNLSYNNVVLNIKISHFAANFIAFSTNNHGVYLSEFSNQNGNITYNQIPIGTSDIGTQKSCYGIEFSRNRLFYNCRYMTAQQNLFESAIRYIPINNPNNESTLFTATGSNNQFGSLQISPNNMQRIYFTIDGFNSLSEINDPDINSIPTFNLQSIILNSSSTLGLPQIVHTYRHDEECFENVSLISPNFDVYSEQSDLIQSSDFINASNYLESNSTTIYHAGNSIILGNNFYASSGAVFRGYIEGCTNIFSGRESNKSNTEIKDNFESKLRNDLIGKILIYPNPSNSIITISNEVFLINKIIVNSIDGKQVLIRNIENKNSFDIDISGLLNGIYIMYIETIDGKIFTEKLIKN